MVKKESSRYTGHPIHDLHTQSIVRAKPVDAPRVRKITPSNRTPLSQRYPSHFKQTPLLIISLITAILFCLAMAVFISGVAYLSIEQSSKILPHVITSGPSIGGKTIYEAAELLHQVQNLSHTITLTNQIVSLDLPITDLGISVDAEETAQIAYRLGRSGNIITRIKTIFQAYSGGIKIESTLAVDTEKAQKTFENLSHYFSQFPEEASFFLENDEVKANPGQLGYTINIDDALLQIRGNPKQVFYSQSFVLPLQPVLPGNLDLSSLLVDAQRVVDTPLELILYDPILDQWTTEVLPKTILLDWLTVSRSVIGADLRINPTKISEYLAAVNQNLSPSRLIDINQASPMILDAILNQSHPVILIHHSPAIYNVQAGDTFLKIGWKLGFPYWQIINANPSIDPGQITPGTEINIPSKDILLPLPVILHKRIIISVGEQRLWVYEYGKQIQKFVISTGIDSSPTQPGIFQVQTHVRSAYASIWDLTMPNFLGIYEAWPGFMNGIHGLPTLSNGRLLWANILGKPASYGCIILDLKAAEWLYHWAEDGVVVEIRP
jgi:lipoprotein-anchoring transpeptidase ErfK/SrfK